MTQVEMIRSTPGSEELVCTMARNDYRGDGVLDYDYDTIIEGGGLDYQHLADVVREGGYEDKTPEMIHKVLMLQSHRTIAKERTLLSHLQNHGHWGPYEHPSATIVLEGVTRVSMAQITRHRQFTFDIMSLRYVSVDDVDDVEDRFQIPECVRDGEGVSRTGVHEIDPEAEEEFIEAYEEAIERYQNLLEMNVPAEEARKVLPMGTKVNIGMSGNARAWMHLLNIRGKADVQGEARRLSDAIMEECKEWMPFAFTHYDDKLPMALNP